MIEKLSTDKALLNRGNLRDLVIILGTASILVKPQGETPIVVGFAILTIGTLLHFLVKGVLIRNSVVCRDGIYGLVRHPYYLANFVIDSAFCMMSGNIYLVFIYPFLFFWAYGPTMRTEENHLRWLHGEEYTSFANDTPQILPDPHFSSALKKLFSGFSAGRITTNELSRLGRFWGVAFFLAWLQELRVDGLSVLLWPQMQNDWDVALFMALGFLMVASSAAMALGRKSWSS